jgi:hypothetical protein
MIKLIFWSVSSILLILLISVLTGYFNIEHATLRIEIHQLKASGDSLILKYQDKSNYIGFPDSRIQAFEEANRNAPVKFLFSKLNNRSRYHEWGSKPIDISLQLRELNSTPQDTFTLRITGTIDGFCSPQSARELSQLLLAKLEYGLIEASHE